MMKILYVLNTSSLAGANRSLISLIRYMTEIGIECFFIIPYEGPIEKEIKKYNGIYQIFDYRPCVCMPGYRGIPWLINLKNMFKIIKKVKEWDIDIVHSNSSSHDIGFIISRILKKKHVWHVRESMELHYGAKCVYPVLYKYERMKTEKTICVSNFIYNLNNEMCDKNKIHMIYNPYVVENYYIERNGLWENRDFVGILVAGNITKSKGQMDAVVAIHNLIKERIYDFRMFIVGNGDRKELEYIQEYIIKNNLNEYIQILSFIEDLSGIRKSCDISLNCSLNEALPRVTVEAMLAGMVCIGTNTGGTAEVIGDNERGYIYQAGDVHQLSDTFKYIMEHKEEASSKAIEAQNYAIKNFDYKISGEKILDIYNSII